MAKVSKKEQNDKTNTNNNPFPTRIAALIIGFSINVIGNSLTVVSNEGAEPWTAAAVNLGKVTGASIGSFVIVFGIINAVLNQLILSIEDRKKLASYQEHRRRVKDLSTAKRKSKEAGYEQLETLNHTFIDKFRFISEVLYIFIFGYAIDWVVLIMDKLHLDQLSKPWEIALSLIGVTLFCLAISIYQRANIFMHPNDDTSNLLRFKFLHGSAFWSQICDIVPALLICGICWLILGTMYSISWGTIYSLVCNGIIVGMSDKWIWPSLVHNRQKKHTYQYTMWF